MSAPRYAVEKILSQILVVVSSPELLEKFSQKGSSQDLEITAFTPAQSQGFTFEPTDATLVFLDDALSTYFQNQGREVWEKILGLNSKLFIMFPSWIKPNLDLPANCYQIKLGEYLGLGGGGEPTLSQLTRAIKHSHHLVLEGNGLNNLSLLPEAIVLDSVFKIILSPPSTNQIYLFNPDQVSLNTLAQTLITSLDYPVRLEYHPSGLEPIKIPSKANLYSIAEDISTLELATQYFHAFSDTLPQTLPEPAPSPAPIPIAPPPAMPSPSPAQPKAKPTNLSSLEFVPIHKKSDYSRLAPSKSLKYSKFALKGVLFGLGLYLISLFAAASITYLTGKKLVSSLRSESLDQLSSHTIAKLSGKYLYINAIALGANEASQLIDLYNQSLIIGDTLVALNTNLKNIANYVFTDSGDNLASSISQARLNAEDLYQQVSLLDGAMPSATPNLLSSHTENYQSAKTKLSELKKNILIGKVALSIVPDFIGVGSRAKYGILFQNNMELRSTGGFIGSLGILSFENGKVYDLEIFDVYQADGQLKGHVEPPTPIKNYLGEANWYLRDSNFDPDFPTSARRAEWFLKKTLNLDVQGTIGINLDTLKSLLVATGPLELPDYNETVNAGNIYERAQFHAEVNFFPGSTAKKEFLSSVSDALMTKIKAGGEGILLKTLFALSSSLEQNNIQISALNPGSEKVFDTLGWSGKVENKPCPTTPCYSEYYYQVDNNYGVNKANFYIDKLTNLDLTFGKDGKLSSTLTTTWKNTATSNAWPAGTYKNYTRTYLPSGSTIKSIVVGDQILTEKDYTVQLEHDKLILAYLVTVPVGSSVTSTISYDNSIALKAGTLFTLYHQKQSGVKSTDQVKVSLSYPLYLKPTQISPEAEVLPQQLIFQYKTDTDHRLTVQF